MQYDADNTLRALSKTRMTSSRKLSLFDEDTATGGVASPASSEHWSGSIPPQTFFLVSATAEGGRGRNVCVCVCVCVCA